MTNFDETRLFDSNFYDKNDIHNKLLRYKYKEKNRFTLRNSI